MTNTRCETGCGSGRYKFALAPDAQLSHAAERLIARHVDSAGALDLLLLLHGGRERDWGVAELCAALRCPQPWAEGQIDGLVTAGLAVWVAPGRLKYQRKGRFGPAVDEIARACRRDRAPGTRLIFTRPPVPGREFAG